VRPTLFGAHLEALVRAELLGKVSKEGGRFRAWPTPAGDESDLFPTAIKAGARRAEAGSGSTCVRHSYASCMITSGMPVPDVQRCHGP
jgi:hypothetical protein